MAHTNKPLKTIGSLIDQIEQVREELLAIQSSMEDIESGKMAEPAKKSQKLGPSAMHN